MRSPSSLSTCILKTYSDGDCHMPWKAVQVNDSLLTISNFFFFIKMKPLQVQLTPIIDCPLHASPYEKRVSILFVVMLQVLVPFEFSLL